MITIIKTNYVLYQRSIAWKIKTCFWIRKISDNNNKNKLCVISKINSMGNKKTCLSNRKISNSNNKNKTCVITKIKSTGNKKTCLCIRKISVSLYSKKGMTQFPLL